MALAVTSEFMGPALSQVLRSLYPPWHYLSHLQVYEFTLEFSVLMMWMSVKRNDLSFPGVALSKWREYFSTLKSSFLCIQSVNWEVGGEGGTLS